MLLRVPSALGGSPVLCRVKQVDLHQPFVRATDATHRPLLSVDFGGLADIAGKVCQGLGFPKDSARFLSITMPSLSQALHLGDCRVREAELLPPPALRTGRESFPSSGSSLSKAV